MRYGSRSRLNANNSDQCPNCGVTKYYRNDCYNCKDLPLRKCEPCGRVSQTAGSACLHCEAPLPRALVFGADRLPADVAACKAWPKNDANPFATKSAQRFMREAKKVAHLISGMRSCFVCGGQFQLGDRDRMRSRIVPNPDWDGVSNWGQYKHDVSQKAHSSCRLTADEEAAQNPTLSLVA